MAAGPGGELCVDDSVDVLEAGASSGSVHAMDRRSPLISSRSLLVLNREGQPIDLSLGGVRMVDPALSPRRRRWHSLTIPLLAAAHRCRPSHSIFIDGGQSRGRRRRWRGSSQPTPSVRTDVEPSAPQTVHGTSGTVQCRRRDPPTTSTSTASNDGKACSTALRHSTAQDTGEAPRVRH